MRLASILGALPAQDLRFIARAHRLADVSGAHLTEALKRHLTEPVAFRASLGSSSEEARRFIGLLAAGGHRVGFAQALRERLTEADLLGLHEKGLAFLLPSTDDPQEVVLPLEYLFMEDLPLTQARDLISGLRVYEAEDLRRIALSLGLSDQRFTGPYLAAEIYGK